MRVEAYILAIRLCSQLFLSLLYSMEEALMETCLQRWGKSALRRQLAHAREPHRPTRQTARPSLEWLEDRLVLSSPTITLDPTNDEFGAQIQTVTQFGNANRVTLGILDTGASPITVASADQAGFADPLGNPDPIPVKVPGGAAADGIGGSVTGDVSKPITVLTDGLHAASLSLDFTTFNFTVTAAFNSTSAKVNGIQAFIGTDIGSPDLPTISGSPIFAGGFNTPTASNGHLAAKVDLINGVDFYGIGLLEPDVNFVSSTSNLTPALGEQLATLALAPIGTSNLANPGNDVSGYYNFASKTVQLNNLGYSDAKQTFLFDTGSQLTVISTAEADALHIDLSKPFDTIDVAGVGGTQTVNGYVIDSLSVGLTDGGTLTFKNVPVFVLDAAPGVVDGILGMNLWNYVDQMLINPFTPNGLTTSPTVSITWDPNYVATGGAGGLGFAVNALFSGHAGQLTLHDLLGDAARNFQVPAEQHAVPTGSTPLTLTARIGQVAPASIMNLFLEARVGVPATGPTVVPVSSTTTRVPEVVPLPSVAPTPLPGASSGSSGEQAPLTEVRLENAEVPILYGAAGIPESDQSLPFGLEDPTRVEAVGEPATEVSDACFVNTYWMRDDAGEARAVPLETSNIPVAAALVGLGLITSGYWIPETRTQGDRRRPVLGAR
jgi:hypothetical protein